MIVSSEAQTLHAYSKSILEEIVNVLFKCFLFLLAKKLNRKNIGFSLQDKVLDGKKSWYKMV
jgi:hypothetical protein